MDRMDNVINALGEVQREIEKSEKISKKVINTIITEIRGELPHSLGEWTISKHHSEFSVYLTLNLAAKNGVLISLLRDSSVRVLGIQLCEQWGNVDRNNGIPNRQFNYVLISDPNAKTWTSLFQMALQRIQDCHDLLLSVYNRNFEKENLRNNCSDLL